MANEYLQSPFNEELVNSLRSIRASEEDYTIKALTDRLLSKVQEVVEKREVEHKSFIQTFLDSYR